MSFKKPGEQFLNTTLRNDKKILPKRDQTVLKDKDDHTVFALYNLFVFE